MRIAEIRIGRFGRWSDLTLPIPARGLSVVYGPNEAGKSTLMRFIRSVLYGFDPFGPEKPASHSAAPCSGSLRIECDGTTWSISRTAQRGSRGIVSIDGGRDRACEGEVLERLLAQTDERIFERVFAIGLHELQELATLHENAVADHIYGISLGPEGERLLAAGHQADAELRRLLDADRGSGELVDLLSRHDELLTQLDEAAEDRERHRELRRNIHRLEMEIADIRVRQEGIESQLRGHQFLERVWKPWKQVRECESALEKLPRIDGFPERGVERLDEIEHEIRELTGQRDAVKHKMEAARQQSAELSIDETVRLYAPAMRALVEHRDWFTELRTRRDALRAECDALELEILEAIEDLGPEWTIDRLGDVDASPEADLRLRDAGRRYRAAAARRNRLRKGYRRRAGACQRRLAAFHDALHGVGDGSLDAALEAARKHVDRMDELSRATIRETELQERQETCESRIASLSTRLAMPRWVFGVLAFLGIVGVLAVVLGIIFGATWNAVAGSTWALLGCTSAALAWAMKSHYESAAAETMDRLLDESHQNAVRLRETRQAIERLTQSAGTRAGRTAAERTNTTDQVRKAVQNLAELERLSQTRQRLEARRKRLSAERARLRERQREVGATRLAWCQALAERGLKETIRVPEGLAQWERVAAASRQYALWKRLTGELEHSHRLLDAMEQRVGKLGSKLGRGDLIDADPAVTLSRWQSALERFAESRSKSRKLRRELSLLRREAGVLSRRLRELDLKRAALLVQGGASSREEFEARARLVAERKEAEELLELATAELDAAAETEPDMAIVEEDLAAYNAGENRRCIEVLASELGELEAEREQALENLGRLRQMIKDLEAKDRSADLRLEQAQIEERFRRTAAEWLALRLAAGTVAEMKSEFERTCQPATLAAASVHLRQLTDGRYTNIWTPLGERHLRVDDETGRTFRVEQLSNGTREQLFLAIRLALVSQFSAKNVSLPMVLDDVIVNFDQSRTEAAVDTLIDFAQREDQQILLFTCHLHLAQMFENRGIAPIRLPGRQPAAEERAAG